MSSFSFICSNIGSLIRNPVKSPLTIAIPYKTKITQKIKYIIKIIKKLPKVTPSAAIWNAPWVAALLPISIVVEFKLVTLFLAG